MNTTTASQRVGCYKCGALDHVATNRNCPRPRKAPTVATVSAAASRAMPPPPPPPPDRESEPLKEARGGEDTCFWCYTDDGSDGGGGASPSGDKDKDSRAKRGCGFKWPGSGKKLELKAETAAPGESCEIDWCGVMAFAAFSSDMPDCHSHHNHNRQNHHDHQEHRDYQDCRNRNHNFREAVGTTVSTTTLSAAGEVMPPPTPPFPKKVQRKTGTAKVRADRGHSGDGAAAQSPGSAGTRARTAAPAPRKKVTPAKQRPLLSPPKTAPPPAAHEMPCLSVGIGTTLAPNALLVPDPEDAHYLSDSTISPPPHSRRCSASTNASPGADGVHLSQDYLDWCDLPQNDPFAQQNWAHLDFNYIGDRNPDLGAGRVRYGRRLQGWRECRSLGGGLGHPFP